MFGDSIRGWLILTVVTLHWSISEAGTISEGFGVQWGGADHVIIDRDTAILKMDEQSGGGMLSRKKYLYGNFSMQIQLIPGNAGGTIATFYMITWIPTHDEIDFEFLGQPRGHPYVLQTNIFSNGIGGREQKITLWFDPTAGFHTYTILWNPVGISFYVDGVAIRQHLYTAGVRPLQLPLEIQCSLWNATWGSGVEPDWSLAPFVAHYRGYDDTHSCTPGAPCPASAWKAWTLDRAGWSQIRRVRSRYLVYDYCRDHSRYPGGLPIECGSGRY